MAKWKQRKIKSSGTMGCDICGIKIPLEEHHIHGRNVREWNKPWNIANLCPNHHSLLHCGDIIIEGWFNSGGDRTLVWRNKDEESITGQEASPYNWRNT